MPIIYKIFKNYKVLYLNKRQINLLLFVEIQDLEKAA